MHELVKTLGMSGVSKSQVSRLYAEIEERVGAFLNRRPESDRPYLGIGATNVKTREAGRIVMCGGDSGRRGEFRRAAGGTGDQGRGPLA